MRFSFFLALLCACITVNAKTYYFSAGGNDAYSFQQAQSTATPWRTIEKLNTIFSSLNPGDSILLKSGDIFSGSLIISNSGLPSQPIVISSYGGMEKPVITGLTTVNAWTLKGTNLWESNHGLKLNRINTVIINGRARTIGRYPNENAASKGYLYIDNAIGNVQITDKDLPAFPNWTGGEVVIRKNRWITDRNVITNHSGNNIFYQSESGYPAYNKYGYFIQNHPSTLDQFGEWFSREETSTVGLLWPENPSKAVVQISTIEMLVTSVGQSNITFDGIVLRGANSHAFNLSNTRQFEIKNCDIVHSGVNGINASGCNNVTIENCLINYSSNNGISGQGCSNFTIRKNTINNSGMVSGAGKGGDGNYEAIVIDGDSELIELNTIDSTGYIPITFRGNENVVKNNFINNFTLVKDDGGGIYTWNNIPGIINHGNKIIGNVVLNGRGAGEGTEHPDYLAANGIYMDDGTANAEIVGNTVAFCGLQSLYIHNAHEVKIQDNTFFDSRKQMSIIRDNFAPQSPVRNLDFKNNIVFSKESDQLIAEFWTDFNDIAEFGEFDDNYYARPVDDNAIISTNYRVNGGNVNKHLTLDGWKNAFQKDKNSKKSPIKVPSSDFIRFEYNATGKSRTVTLNAEYVDVKNKKYKDALTLDPFSSIILIQSSGLGDTSVPESACPGLGSISREQWNNVSGTTINDIPVYKTADLKSILSSFEAPTNVADNYGSRIRGYICPPKTGKYTFLLAGDDNSELWLSTDDHSENKTKIAYIDAWTNPREWNKYASQKSAKIELVEGRKYYIEALHKEGGGGDNLAVAWQFPNGIIEAPIAGKRLSPFEVIEMAKNSQTISFNSIKDKTFGDAAFEISATASSGLEVSFKIVSGPATINGNVISINGIGAVEIIASQQGNEKYLAAPNVIQRFNVNASPIVKNNQTINFNAIPNKLVGDVSFALSATSSASLPVSFRVISGPAAISGNMVTLSVAGTVTIEATQTGNETFNAAIPVQQTFSVIEPANVSLCSGTGKIAMEVWEEVKGTNVTDIPTHKKASKVIDLTSFESQANIDDNYGLRIRGYLCPPITGNYTFFIAGDDAGELYISASELASAKVKIASFTAPTHKREWTKYPSQQSVKVYLEAGKRFYIEALMKDGIGEDHLSVAWQLPDGTMEAPIKGGRLSIYNGVETVKAAQTITFNSIPAKEMGDAAFDLQAVASSGLPVIFVVKSGSAKLSGNTITLTGSGMVEVEASQQGNAVFFAASPVVQRFEVKDAATKKAGQTITFTTIPSKTLGDAPFPVFALATSGLPVVFKVYSGPATISGNMVTLTGIGKVVLQASQSGNDNYSAAIDVLQSFSVIDNAPSTCSATGKITREIWEHIKGNKIESIPFLSKATKINEVDIFESRRDLDDNYGVRIRGYICPPQTGNYVFWISGDEAGELFLSSNDLASDKVKIAAFESATGYRQWNKSSTQKSAFIHLEAGRRYYIEAVMKEQIGEDHLSVAWQLPNGAMEAPIPGSRLSTYNDDASLRLASPLLESIEQPVENLNLLETAGNLQVYPNPVRVTSTIAVHATETEAGIIELLDLHGKRLRLLFNGNIEKGTHKQLQLESLGLQPGIYIIRFVAGKQLYTKKIVVIR